MTHYDQSVRSGADVIIKDFSSSQVKVIAGLIQQYTGWLMNKNTGKENFCFLPAAKQAHRNIQIERFYVPGFECLDAAFFEQPVIVEQNQVSFSGLSCHDVC